jgi:hypothetical protein
MCRLVAFAVKVNANAWGSIRRLDPNLGNFRKNFWPAVPASLRTERGKLVRQLIIEVLDEAFPSQLSADDIWPIIE